MLERLAALEEEYEAVLAKLQDPAVLGDHHLLREQSRRHKELEPIVARYRELRAVQEQLAEAKELLHQADGEDREEWRSIVEESEAEQARLVI